MKKRPVLFYLPVFLALLTAPLSIGQTPGGQSGSLEVFVLDSQGQPLEGVNIFTEEGERMVLSTDRQGRAELPLLSEEPTWHFSYLGYAILALSPAEIRAREGRIVLSELTGMIEQVLVVGRRDDRPSVVPYRLETIRAEELALTNPQTSADALAAHGGVFVQKSQMGGGSPIIRGFEANRILLVLDGVRLNNAIYREGHLQNAITVDAGMLQQAEVLFGPGSLMYGSDALGGVVHFRSKDPKLHYGPDNPQPEVNFYTRFAGANREKSFHTDINLSGRRWAALSSITLSDYDDLRAGSRRPDRYPEFGKRLFYAEHLADRDTVLPNPDPDRQVGTAYAQLDLMQKLRFQPNESLFFIANLQYSTSTDIPRYDRLTETLSTDPADLKFAEWYYGPQNRLLVSLKTRLLQPTPLYERATLIAAYQKIDEDRFDRRLHHPWRSFQKEDVQVFSLTADFDKKLMGFRGVDLSYGLDLAHNRVRSSAGRENLLTGETDERELTRYPAERNRMSSFGAYLNLQKTFADSLAIGQVGARWSRIHLFSRFRNDGIIRWPEHYFDPGLELDNQNLTWASSLRFNLPGRFSLVGIAATAFRSPNTDDFAKIREKDGFVTIPNPDLKPERSLSLEAALAKSFGSPAAGKGFHLHLSLSVYHTWLKDAIIRRVFALPDGSTTLFMDGEALTTIANVNTESARVHGADARLEATFGPHWKLRSSFNFTRGTSSFRKELEPGRLLDTLLPMAHIPPAYGQTTLLFEKGRWELALNLRYNGPKPLERYAVNDVRLEAGRLVLIREGTSDNLEQSYWTENPAEPHPQRLFEGTPAWQVWNFYSAFRLTPRWRLTFAVENLFDLHYRPFSSGVSAAGRNFILSLRGGF